MKVTAKLKQGYYFLDHPVRRRSQRTQLQYVTCKQKHQTYRASPGAVDFGGTFSSAGIVV